MIYKDTTIDLTEEQFNWFRRRFFRDYANAHIIGRRGRDTMNMRLNNGSYPSLIGEVERRAGGYKVLLFDKLRLGREFSKDIDKISVIADKAKSEMEIMENQEEMVFGSGISAARRTPKPLKLYTPVRDSLGQTIPHEYVITKYRAIGGRNYEERFSTLGRARVTRYVGVAA